MVAKMYDDPESALVGGRNLAHPPPGDEVVISGTAGVFPDSDNMADFADKLFNKVDLISDDDRRWKLDHPEIPHRTGKLNDIAHFDAAFFGIHYKQAHTMDPMCRILLEKTYEAVVDAGYNPRTLYGSRMGVFIGACFSESEKTWLYEKLQVNGFGITGCSRAMLANRVSYWLGVDGPSYTVDSACSSSMYALEHGYRAIRDGECDSAIVGGCNLCLHPHVSLQFARLGVLSMDGRCKSFDEAANGYCRSEAVSVMFLQKKKDARRIYATLIHAKTNCDGYKEQGITFPSGPQQQVLLEDFYNECQVDPSTLAWIEAHGTGTKVGDPEEVKALENVFCKNRNESLKIGSVKSNIGHSEPASGVCSISKVIIAMETGHIPPNINFTTPKSDIEAFHNGKITVITEKTPWEGGLVGVNSFGFGGANGHVLLRWNEKNKANGAVPRDDWPRLISISGRTEQAVDNILTYLENQPLDGEFVKLFHEIHKDEIPGHLYRGYTILSKTGEHIRDIKYISGRKRQIWCIFSGLSSLASTWPGLASNLLTFPIFAAAVEKCYKVLSQYNIDIFNILRNQTEVQNNPLYYVLATATVQIGLVDLLNAIGLTPDGYIGQSFGEIGCAYMDRNLSAEEAILTAYHIGSVFQGTIHKNGSMALIGVHKNNLNKLCPHDVEIVTHYGENCIVSGPTQSIKKLLIIMKEQNISLTELSAKSACHSRLIKAACPTLIKNLEKVIIQPKVQTSKWINTTITKGDLQIKSNADYFCNNLMGPIYFEEAIQQIPHDAIVIEISPHGILQLFLQNSLDKASHVSLMNINENNNLRYLLSSLGKIGQFGANLDLSKLYPEITFPVSRSTPMIAPLIKWDHSEDWYVTTYRTQDKIKSGERPVSINLKNEDMEYLAGHNIDGRVLFPATGYLVLVWETIGLMRGELHSDIPVVFENVRFLRATNMTKDGAVDFVVMIQKVSGNFEVVEGGVAVVTGRIYVPDDINKESSGLDISPVNEEELILSSKDIYKEFRLRGYNYKGLFRSLVSADDVGVNGRIKWHCNWVPFMDNMLQMMLLSNDTRGLFVPTYIERVLIDAKKHIEILNSLPDETVPVYANKEMELIQSGGIEIRNLRCTVIQRRKPLGEPVIEKHVFTPYFSANKCLSINNVVRMLVQLVLENEPSLKVKVIEMADSLINPEGPLFAPIISQALGDLPLIQADISVLTNLNNPLVSDISNEISVEDKKLVPDQSALIVTASNILGESSSEVLNSCLGAVKDGGFIIAREKPNATITFDGLTKCAEHFCYGEVIILLKKKKHEEKNYEIINITNKDFAWLTQLQNAIKNEVMQRIYLVSQNEFNCGILGLTNCIRKEPGGEKIRTYFVMDSAAPTFTLDNTIYATQAMKDFVTNVYKNGEWGSYCHLPLETDNQINSFHAFVNVTTRGDLASLRWIQGPVTGPQYKIMDHQALVYVCYSALNFRDIMTATAKIAPEVVSETRLQLDCVQGLEYSGIDEDGRYVMGMASQGALASVIVADKPLMWEYPKEWTLEEAATVPVVYGTVLYAFIKFGRVTKGETILIHAGSGGIGLAAIHLAIFYGCNIFTTVGTKEKREFIKNRFPQLTDNRIGNSRDTSFEQLIMRETNGRGVDIILNSLSEEKLLASVRCLAPGGRFLEIGKFDLANNNPLGMDLFTNERSFQGIMLDKVLNARPEEKMELTYLLADAIKAGAIVPLPRTTFQNDEIEQAFRYMATGKHIGKILVKVRNSHMNSINPEAVLLPAIPRFYCNPDKSYIIVGGLGGFGLELADWLVLRGAKNLILSSRTGLKNGYQSYRIRIWKSYGVRVCISTLDVTTDDGVQALLKEAASLGPVGGIFNLAVVLRDALLENQTESDFKISLASKATATNYFDIYSRNMCPQLDQFIVFSSVSCGRGNMGQTNYGMANSIMERICEARAVDGLPALAVQWGAVGDVGLVAEMQEENTEIIIGGTLQQQISSCLQVLDTFINQKHPVVSSMVVAEKRVGAGSSESIVDTVANILGLRDLKTVSLHSTLAELGMDSMMAVEIKQTLEREFEVFLTPQDIRGMTFAKLHDYVTSDKAAKDKQADTGETKTLEFGLNFLIRVIGDEKDFDKPLIRLESKYYSGSQEDEIKIQNPVFILPGIEGRSSIVDPIAKKINFPVFGLQFDPKCCNTIENIAYSLKNSIKEYLAPGSSFSIVGYSFGGVVAVEVVRQLEADGYTGKLCLIDSSPEFIKAVIKSAFLEESEDDVQEKVIEHFMHLLWPQYTSLTGGLLKQNISWDSKIDQIVEASPYNDKYSKEFQKLTISGICNRVNAAIKYENPPNKSILSIVTLIRPTEITLSSEDDYGISKMCKNEVMVHFITGNHMTILENKATADIINTIMA